MWSPCGVHRWSPHGVLTISDSPSGLHVDSSWSLRRLLGTSRKCFHGFPWSPHGVHVDSLWTPQSLHGLRGNPWGSVKCSHFVIRVTIYGNTSKHISVIYVLEWFFDVNLMV